MCASEKSSAILIQGRLFLYREDGFISSLALFKTLSLVFYSLNTTFLGTDCVVMYSSLVFLELSTSSLINFRNISIITALNILLFSFMLSFSSTSDMPVAYMSYFKLSFNC